MSVAAEPSAFASSDDAPPPLLLRFAASGLASKLLFRQIAEVVAIFEGLEKIVAASEANPLVVSLAFVLLRGVRGLLGVPWAVDVILASLPSMTEAIPTSFCQEMWKRFQEDSLGKAISWASHIEGRHTWRSGRWFIEALATDEGRDGWLRAAGRLLPIVSRILEGSAGEPVILAPTVSVECMQAVENTVLLAVTPKKIRAQNYNAMDFGRLLLTWAIATGRGVEAPLDQSVLNAFMQRQAKGRPCKSPAVSLKKEHFGFSSVTQVKPWLDALSAVVRPLGTQEPPSWLMEPLLLTWVCLLVFLCESRQVVNEFTADELELILGSSIATIDAAAVPVFRALQEGRKNGGRFCHMGASRL